MTVTYQNFASVVKKLNGEDRKIMERAGKMLFPAHSLISEVIGDADVVLMRDLSRKLPSLTEHTIGRALGQMDFVREQMRFGDERQKVWVRQGVVNARHKTCQLIQWGVGDAQECKSVPGHTGVGRGD